MSLAAAHATLAELNEGAITAQAKIILHGLGFTEEMDCPACQRFLGRLAKPFGFGPSTDVPCRTFATRRTDKPSGP